MQPPDSGGSSRRVVDILRASEERFRLLVEGVRDYAIFMLDTDGRVTTWNLGAERIKGYETEEIIGEHFSIFYTDEDVERGHPDEVLRVAAAEGRYEEEGIRVRKDGSTFWANVLITALRDDAGNLRGFAKVTRDITARKEAEERERLLVREQAAKERATDILESISDAFFAVDRDWRFTYVNSKAEDLWGRPREELLGQNLWEAFPETGGSESFRQIRRAMDEGTTTEFETIFPVIDTWIAGRAYPSLEGLSVYFRDVTERKQAEEERARLAAIVESSDDVILGKTLDGIITSWNRGAERIYGYSTVEVVGQPVSMLVPPERPNEIPDILERIRRGEKVDHFETVRMTKDGRRLDISLTVSPIRNAEGDIVGASTIARDITERRRAQEELRGSRDQLDAILRGAADGITAQDPTGRIVYANEAAARLVGFPSARELVEASVQEVVERFELMDEEGRPFPVERLPGRRALAGEEGAEAELRFRVLATGEERWSIVKAMPIFGERGSVRMAVNIFRDITERKQAADALRKVTEAERRRIARDLHDGVLQDLSYTAAALGLVTLEVEGTKLEERLQASVDAVRRAAQGLRDAVNDLRLEDEEGRPFAELVESLVKRTQSTARDLEIGLEVVDGFPSAPLGETGTQVSRVIQEAITNARRHSGAKSVSVSLKTEGSDLLVEVSDDGRGFGPESTPGVGQSSMRERAAIVGGTLVIESEVGRGTTVSLRVPRPWKG